MMKVNFCGIKANINESASTMSVVLTIIAIVLAAIVLSFLAVAGLMWLVCLGFELAWSWELSLGVWAVIVLMRFVFGDFDGGK